MTPGERQTIEEILATPGPPGVPVDTAFQPASKAWEFLDRMVAAVSRYGPFLQTSADLLNLFTYSADLGPDARTDAAMAELAFGQQRFSGAGATGAWKDASTISVTDKPFSLTDPSGLHFADPFGYTAPATTTLEATIVGTRPSAAAATMAAISPLTWISPNEAGIRVPARVATPVRVGTAASVSTGVGLGTGLGDAFDYLVKQGVLPALGILPGLGIAPVPYEQPQPFTKGEVPTKVDCQPGGNNKKKDKKQRHERSVCHRGTYVELKSGLLKYRKETIPCR